MRKSTIDLMVGNEKLIRSVAYKMALHLGWRDVDELESFGREMLIRKMPKYDSSRGAFTTFATWVLQNAMKDYVHCARRLVPSSVKIDGEQEVNWLENQADPSTPDSLPSRLQDLMDGCSEAAREVVAVILSSDLEEAFGNPHRPLIEKVRKMLCARGWDRRQTHQAFSELITLIGAW